MKISTMTAALILSAAGFLGSEGADAASANARSEASAESIIQVGGRWDRWGGRDRWDRRHHHWRPRHQRCEVRWEFRLTPWGPEWYPVRYCRQRRHWW